MRVLDLGRKSYAETYEIQKEAADEVLSGAEEMLILVEHDPVLTLGTNFHEKNLLLTLEQYGTKAIEVVKTDRGGDVTFHGPGQLVAYPIFELRKRGQDLHKWLRDIEGALIETALDFGLEGLRFPPHTGVWLKNNIGELKKVAAIGIKVRKWVNMHGIALNCDNDLAEFDLIVPCGIEGYGVTSLSEAAGRKITVDEAKTPLIEAFTKI